ncbi:unnamed protein product [Polarella glacialis]|uniref:SAC3/GANP/THP3 conserved domain-containing protein n=1 Tax=Polarella glacialis TaxID=89957 RepID=A0A813FW18_POLGL|nr:unnamed protein product [Polarella glacialis]CAE8714575.1 unnamed protein product [Polarella glacialis]
MGVMRTEMPQASDKLLVGALAGMCSEAEALERQRDRQLDRLEWKPGSDPRQPEVDMALATKKYQRSSAGKMYCSKEVRSPQVCWQTMKFLLEEVLDLDQRPSPRFAAPPKSFWEVYAYMHDRSRSVRVDLHLQQPRSSSTRAFVECHECSLRFELLSRFLLQRRPCPPAVPPAPAACPASPSASSSGAKDSSGGYGSKPVGEVLAALGQAAGYSERLGLQAMSQTIDPLLAAYDAARRYARSGVSFSNEDEAPFVSSCEPVMQRLVLLLLLCTSPSSLPAHLARLGAEVVGHPVVRPAVQACGAFLAGDYSRFLRFYRESDFLSAAAMSSLADLARLRVLWITARAYPHAVGDKLPLSRLQRMLACGSEEHVRSFLAFHGISVQDGPDDSQVLFPKRDTPEAEGHLCTEAELPDRCDFPAGADELLASKVEGLLRVDVVLDAAGDLSGEGTSSDVSSEAFL